MVQNHQSGNMNKLVVNIRLQNWSCFNWCLKASTFCGLCNIKCRWVAIFYGACEGIRWERGITWWGFGSNLGKDGPAQRAECYWDDHDARWVQSPDRLSVSCWKPKPFRMKRRVQWAVPCRFSSNWSGGWKVQLDKVCGEAAAIDAEAWRVVSGQVAMRDSKENAKAQRIKVQDSHGHDGPVADPPNPRAPASFDQTIQTWRCEPPTGHSGHSLTCWVSGCIMSPSQWRGASRAMGIGRSSMFLKPFMSTTIIQIDPHKVQKQS